jgi:hypothetical protein
LLERGDDLAVEVFVVLDDEKAHATESCLVDRFDLARDGVDRDVHEAAIAAKGHDDVEKMVLHAAKVGPNDVGARDRVAGCNDGHRRRHDLLFRHGLAHLAWIEAVQGTRRAIGAREAEGPEKGRSDPRRTHDGTLPRVD